MVHSLRTIGAVEVKTLFIDPLARADLPNQCQVYEVTPLLRELIIQAVNIKNVLFKESRESRIIELILDELRVLNSLDFHVPMPKESSNLYKFCLKVSKRLDHPWSVSDASLLLQISDKTVSRQFHQQLRLSFSEWLRRKRLLESMELLAQGLNVIDAALSVGYESPSSFSAMFKSRVGMSPAEYASQIG
ncbi:AraC family transcriptional regulator [Vibrio rumoiensis]|uniref:AraC family transcriptional regulator n=1 Tax=Vibrio rumoiensis TaxID=76258 RepID=UPI000B5C9999|nr:AraC family transcriptional regulator [Vibrio rumoiensis]